MEWKPVDVIVAILAFFFSLSLFITVFLPFVTHHDLSVEKAKMIASSAGFISSMIAMYIGSKLHQNGVQYRDDKDKVKKYKLGDTYKSHKQD